MRTAAVICRACNGSGKNARRRPCSRCEGYGHVIAYVTASGHEITNPDVIAALEQKACAPS